MLRDGLAEHCYYGRMDRLDTQRLIGRCQDLSDGPLHDAVAKPPGRGIERNGTIRLRTWNYWLIRQGIEDGLQAWRRVRKVS